MTSFKQDGVVDGPSALVDGRVGAVDGLPAVYGRDLAVAGLPAVDGPPAVDGREELSACWRPA